jgi:predicted phage terminase large subunit-like protein
MRKVKRMAKVQSRTESRRELARRELASRELIDYAEFVFPKYEAGKHHKLIAEKLEAVERYIASGGEEGIGRLIIQAPPRSGKTEIVSKIFPSWFLGRNPDKRVILTSYAADLAEGNSRSVRNYLTSDHFSKVFGDLSLSEAPVRISDDSRSVKNWDLAAPHRGGLLAAGVGGGITGKGADLLVLDDPFKNREEADSEDHRRRVMEWWTSSAYTRLEKGGAVVIIHTRWHPDDVIGQLLQNMANGDPLADQYEILFLPALALEDEDYAPTKEAYDESMRNGLFLPLRKDGDAIGRKPGEALWPEKYPIDVLKKIKANIGEFDFASLFQQLPVLLSGNHFDQKDFRFVEKAPEGLVWCRYVDLALGESRRADWNATAAVAMDQDGNLYIRDMLLIHNLEVFFPMCKELMLSPAERGVIWGLEKVSFQSLAVREFMKDQRLANVALTPIIPEADKLARSRPWQLRAKQKKVFLVKGTWTRSFLNEVVKFPRGKHDDQVDSVSGGVKMLEMYGGGRVREAKQRSWA